MNTERSSQLLDRAASTVAAGYAAASSPGANADLANAAGVLGMLAEQLPRDERAPLRYHQARLLAARGDVSQALQLVDPMISAARPLPETIWLKIQLAAAGLDDASNQLRWRLEDQLGILLPLSGWGLLRDGRLGDREAIRSGLPRRDVPGPEVSIPKVDGAKLLQVARLFAEMHMDSEAANAYREAIYAGFTPPEFPQPGSETWISSEAAAAWLTTARLELQLGRKTWALQALLLAAASSPVSLETARQLIPLFDDPPPPRGKAMPNGTKLAQIAQLYRDCNLHPRALRVLDQASRLPGADVAEETKRIASEWETLVESYKQANEPIAFLFGYKLSATPLKNVSPASFPY